MPSNALQHWQTTRVRELDEIEEAHQTVGGSGRGRRYATQQINHAYTMLLSSQFQGFCRDLHEEAIDFIVQCVNPASLRSIIRDELLLHRKLDYGNPNPGNIGADFNRLGLKFLNQVQAIDARNPDRIDRLDELNRWRNAIAHQDFDLSKLPGTMNLRLATIRRWRRACEQLAVAFDTVIGNHISQITGMHTW